jgi:hypothetical protein
MPNDRNLPIILVGNASGSKVRTYIGGRANIGALHSPAAWRTPWCRWWACDNDVFSNRADPGWWCREGETKWIKMLDKIDAAAFEHGPMFVLLPDVVFDWPQTLRRYHEYLPEVRGRGLPFAIALQDGAESELKTIARLNPHYVFIGGSVQWKWRHAEAFCAYFQPLGIKVHIGRASGPRRVQECIRIGADSADGTGWSRFADKMLPGLWRVLDGADPQRSLEI